MNPRSPYPPRRFPVPDPILAEALVAATDAIQAQPAGTSPAQLARVALEAAVPMIRAQMAVTEWGTRGGVEPDTTVAYGSEEAARYMAGISPGWLRVVCRQVGPWTEVEPREGEDHG